MAFYEIDYEILDRISKDIISNISGGGGSVFEFGSQDIHQDREGKVLGHRVSTKSIYEEYGFSKYQCADLEGVHNALKFDIGSDFQIRYNFCDTFDLVTCKEIAHHAFDQKTLFKNIHNLCKAGGYIILRVPIECGYTSGAFAYRPERILQLCFCNEYLYKGAYLYTEIAPSKRGEIYRFNDKACDFLKEIKTYKQEKQLYKEALIANKRFLLRLTIILQKTIDKDFVVPVFPYVSQEKAMRRNVKSIVENCLPKGVQKVAIFGIEKAAELAYSFAKEAGLEIVCYLDDFKQGEIFGKLVVTREVFKEKFQKDCDLVLLGPYQEYDNEDMLGEILKLEWDWFV